MGGPLKISELYSSPNVTRGKIKAKIYQKEMLDWPLISRGKTEVKVKKAKKLLCYFWSFICQLNFCRLVFYDVTVFMSSLPF